MPKSDGLKKGLLFAFITAVISGFAIFYSKISVAKIDPLVLTTWRNAFVGVVFLLGMVSFGKLKQLKTLQKKDVIILLLIGIIGGGVPFYLFFTGLQFIGAQSANIIHKSLFVWVSILAVAVLGERISFKTIVAYSLVFAGTFFFAPVNLVWNQGTAMVLGATLLWTVETILSKKILVRISSELVGFSRMFVGALFLLAMTAVSGKGAVLFHLSNSQLLTVVVGGSILCGYVFFWYRALKLAPANLVTLVLSFSVVVGFVLNGSFAGVILSRSDVLSSVYIACGVGLVYLAYTFPKLLRQS